MYVRKHICVTEYKYHRKSAICLTKDSRKVNNIFKNQQENVINLEPNNHEPKACIYRKIFPRNLGLPDGEFPKATKKDRATKETQGKPSNVCMHDLFSVFLDVLDPI